MDANQGVQAQTLANYYLALSHNLTVVPVLNKVPTHPVQTGK